MEIIALAVLAVFVFCLGWLTGNVVEWVLTYRDRRLEEKHAADLMQELLRKRSDRE